MFDALKDFLRTLTLDDARPGEAGGDDPRVAAAALLVHVASVDGAISEAELAQLTAALGAEFGLEEAQAARIVRAGRDADRDAVDLFRFTNVLLRALTEDQRVHFVGFLWNVVYADGVVHELEDNTVWRVAELLGVSSRDRMLAKRAAAARNGAAGSAS